MAGSGDARVSARLGLLAALATACGDDTTAVLAPSPDVLREIHDACVALAEVRCAPRELCLETTFATEYGSHATCVERQAKLCEQTRFGEGSGDDPSKTAARVVACAAAWASELGTLDFDDCADWLKSEVGRNPPEECRFEGSLPEGSPCLDGTQCASASCSPIGACGTCREARQDGDVCAQDVDCERALVCVEGKCARFTESGSCGPEKPCNPDLACVAGTCKARLGPGKVCGDAKDDTCELWPDQLACSDRACQLYELRGEGQDCGKVGTSVPVTCEHGFVCESLSIQEPDRGKCVPVVEDGAACGPYKGLNVAFYPFGVMCRAPAECIDNHCKIPHTASCAPPHPP